jgi:hypothetical protein
LDFGLGQQAYILINYPLRACQTQTMKKMGTPTIFLVAYKGSILGETKKM